MEPYYQDDFVTLYNDDCLNVLPHLSGIDLIFTSPPYNLGNTTGGGFPGNGNYARTASLGSRGGSGKWGGGDLANGYDDHDDDLPHADYVEWQKRVVRECWLSLAPNGAIFYNHKPRVLGGVLVTPFSYLPDDLPVRQIVIWARAGGFNFSPTFYVPTHEWIVVIAKPLWRLKSKAASGVGDVWYVPQVSDTEHPAPFPLGLPARAIESTDAMLVCDPFAGSGTTLRAAKDAGVKAIGIEKSERYCDMAVRRLGQESLFGGVA